MTASERVDALEAEWGKYPNWTCRKEAIEAAIAAAVEAEREAIRQIAHAEAMKARAIGLSQLENPALDIERLIRARSNTTQ